MIESHVAFETYRTKRMVWFFSRQEDRLSDINPKETQQFYSMKKCLINV